MSWWTDQRKKVEHGAVRLRKHVQEEGKRFGKWYRKHGPKEIKYKVSSNDDGQTFESNIEINPTPAGNNTAVGNTKPQAYSRTTAATAKDIAQGGMTKDEVQEYNMKHPNETALRSE